MKKINLFFLQKGYYECILTTEEAISKPYDRKITLEFESAKEWKMGTLAGSMGAANIIDLDPFNNEMFYFINAQKWLYECDSPVFMAISKSTTESITDGKEHYTRDLEESLEGSSCVTFLFPKKQ